MNSDFHKQRAKGIGGTDIAAIAKISKWKTPMDVFLEKTGRTEPTATSEVMEWGNRLEPVVRQKYEDVHGYPVCKIDNVMIHNEHPWYRGTPDGIPPLSLIFDHMGFQEFKTTSAYNKADWEETVPAYYVTQVAWYFGLFDDLGISREWVDFGVLIGGNKYVEYRIHRDDEMKRTEKKLFELGRWFWHDHILKDEAPPIVISGSDSCKKSIEALYPDPTEDYITAKDEHSILIGQRLKIEDQIKELAEAKNEIDNMLKVEIAIAEGMKFADGGRIDWKRRAGSTSWKSVADDIAKENPELKDIIKDLKEKHRGKPSRTFKYYAPPKGE